MPKLLEDEVVVNRIHHPTPPPFPITGSGEKSDPHAKSGTKSWASLFASSDPSTERIQVDKPMARIPPFSTSNAALSDAAAASYSQESKNLGAHLKNYRLHHVAPSFLPRGLTNRQGYIYINYGHYIPRAMVGAIFLFKIRIEKFKILEEKICGSRFLQERRIILCGWGHL